MYLANDSIFMYEMCQSQEKTQRPHLSRISQLKTWDFSFCSYAPGI